jgi:hypothetical protein
MSLTATTPILVSFHAGERSYSEAAGRLRDDCTSLGIDHDIEELQIDAGDDWLSICRRKPAFCKRMLDKHRRPIVWLDCDSRLARRPSFFNDAACDFAAFLRGFRYLRDFDPVALPRFFAPFALYFNYTARAAAFLELVVELESECSEAASDDYFLHEAWLRHRHQLSVLVLSPELVGHEWPLTQEQAIYVGISGNVANFKDRAKQHEIPLLDRERRKTVLTKEGDESVRRGEIDEALTFYMRAMSTDPSDERLAERIARIITRHRGTAESESFLLRLRGNRN